jgi:methyl-accepting chemotaxis protein
VNALLYPAIALMNRLSLAMKFSLISLLFFVPLLATNFFIVRDAYTGLVETRTELDSLDLFHATLKVRHNLDTYYDLVQINSVIGHSGNAGDVEKRIRELEQKLTADIGALQAAAGDSTQVADFNSRRDELLASMKAVVAESGLQTKVGMAEKVLTQTVVFLKYVSSQAGISTDRDGAVRLVAEMVTGMTPQVAAVLGTGRAVGSFSLAQGFLDSAGSVRMDDLLLALERTHGEYGLIINEALQQSPVTERQLGALTSASRETLKQGAALFEEQLIVADSLDTPWENYYQSVSALIARTYQVDEASVDFLRQQLAERVAADRLQMTLLIAALVAVFALIVYLYSAFYVAMRGALSGLGKVMHQVADGDMTVSYAPSSNDEIGQLGRTFNDSVAKIHTLIQRVGQTVVEVERQAGRVEGVSAESNQAVASQMGQIEQVATAMNEMSATAQEVARSAAAAVECAQNVNHETLSGRQLVEVQVASIERLSGEIDTSVAVINQLASDSASISQVLDVIKGIAEQTNLLALNAAIEAARAGEQGRGFAVVADEVRNLAKRTQQSTEEIEKMIVQLHNGVAAAVKAMSGSHQMASGTVSESAKVQLSLENILGAVNMIVDQSQQIATAAEEQTAVAHDIDQNLVEINRAGERTAGGASQTEQASRELSRLVAQLKQLIGAFRV